MEFSLRVGDTSFFVFCKFEIVIFKIVQVMTENIPFAFLYVLSILARARVCVAGGKTFSRWPEETLQRHPQSLSEGF